MTTEYFENYAKGIVDIITNDPIATSLFIGSVAVMPRRGISAGVATFFLGYTAMAEVTNLAMTLGKCSQMLSQAVTVRQEVSKYPSPHPGQ